MGFLHEHADPGLELSQATIDAWDPAAWQEEEQVRAVMAAQILTVAASMPRRLGQDASREDLARDKKMARRLEWAMRNAVTDWKGNPDLILEALPDDARRRGAQLVLEQWSGERLAYIQDRKHYCATVCARRGLIKLGSQYVQRYLNEQKHLKWASR